MNSERIEEDGLGERKIPAGALYGISTQRAIECFNGLSGYRLPGEFIRVLAWIKYACAVVNGQMGRLAPFKVEAIRQAAEEIVEGKWEDEFPIDAFQTGSGTSLNMNLNEVLANRAAQILGYPIGRKDPVHPNDDCNAGQSSNDVMPTASNIVLLKAIKDRLLPVLERCGEVLTAKAEEWRNVPKLGRTHLMDAVPLTLGEEFSAFAGQVKNGIAKLKEAIQPFYALPMGGTAVGNGLNAPPAFGPRVVALLGEKLNEPLVPSRNRFETQASRDDIVSLTGVLDTIGASLFKLLNDLRLMNSGPYGGLNELLLPALQPGSSCMPAKVNPVLCDSLLQILCFVHGGNESVRQCALLSGHFQLNTSSTHLVYTLFESIRLLANGTERFTTYYLGQLEPNLSQLEVYLRGSLWEASRLVPILGYDVATALAQRAEQRKKSMVDTVKEEVSQNPFSVQWQRALEVLLEK